MKKKEIFWKWFWGVLLIAVGGILGAKALGLTDINPFFPGWWTLFIIVPCGAGVIFGKRSERLWGALGVATGVSLLCARLGVIQFETIWNMLLPVALVLVGVWILTAGRVKAEWDVKVNGRKVGGRGKAGGAGRSAQEEKIQEAKVVKEKGKK